MHHPRLTSILLCRLILNLRSLDATDDPAHAIDAKQMSSVRFTHAALANIGASLSFNESMESEDQDTSGIPIDETLDKIVKDPLAIDIEDIYPQALSFWLTFIPYSVNL